MNNSIKRDFDIIIGLHSIEKALKNPERQNLKIYATAEGLKEFKKRSSLSNEQINSVDQQIISNDNFHNIAKRLFDQLQYRLGRVPSNILLTCSPLITKDLPWLYQKCSSENNLRLIALDQVTDTHNGAAILRTSAFYGVDALIISQKGNFGFSPSFYRTSSGSTEIVTVVICYNLSKTLRKLDELGVSVIGLSEHYDESFKPEQVTDKSSCIVLGSEDRGLSNAVERCIRYKLSLEPAKEFKTLNVSVAAAISMEKVFNS